MDIFRKADTYDSKGNVLTITRLAGTADAVTATFTYGQQYSQVTSVTDPLGHTTSFGYDGQGNLTSMTDPLTHQTTFIYNAAGQVVTATNAANETTHFGYDVGDPVSTTDPLGRTTSRFFDLLGRLVSQTGCRRAGYAL